MDWQTQLISLYITIADIWNKDLFLFIERESNYNKNFLIIEEVLTILIYGIIKGRLRLKSIYNYTTSHM
ncbi:MAG: hypothetical protein HQK51_11810 [Oligoflexia bacterium]|nr:hypothetical protein [Oligoflexia bacterium]